MIRTLLQSLVLRLPGGLVSALGGWQVKIALALAAILVVAGALGLAHHTGHTSGVSAERAAWQAKVAEGRLILAEAALEAERDAQRRIDAMAVRAARTEELMQELENEARQDPGAAGCGISARGVQRINRLIRSLTR